MLSSHVTIEGVPYLVIVRFLTQGALYLIHATVEGVLYLLYVSEAPNVKSFIP